jgi:hypothetical protein
MFDIFKTRSASSQYLGAFQELAQERIVYVMIKAEQVPQLGKRDQF